MITMNLRSNMAELVKDIDLEQKAIRKSAQRALNTAARGRRTDASRALRERYPKLRKRDADDAFDVRFATPENLQAVITVRGRPFSLARFFVRQDKRKGGGVVVNIKGQRKTVRTAFVANMKNKAGDDYQVVFVREGKSRYPLKALRTIDLPNAVNIKEIAEVLEQQTGERFDKEFLRQLQLELSRRG